jgi:transglutaminase-like putative cysteine protease
MTYPMCVHCGKRIWFDRYGPGWVHFRGTPFCVGDAASGLLNAADCGDPGRRPASGGNRGTRTCPLCNGSGLNPKLLTHVCPKCDGEKVVPR